MKAQKKIANVAIIGLVSLEVGMGLASTSTDIDPWIRTALLFMVLAIGSALQATLLGISLYHRSHNNWRQWPSFAIQGALFLMVAYWAHKGLGNTIFLGVNELVLYAAGLGLGLLTMFGPEVVNHEYDADDTQAAKSPEKPAESVLVKEATFAYQGPQIVPLSQNNGHSVGLEAAAQLLEN